jgi:hypothetical protein
VMVRGHVKEASTSYTTLNTILRYRFFGYKL